MERNNATDDIAKSKARASQKRYRDRVKAQREGIEDQVAVLSRRIAELETTHSSLEDRNRSLKRFVELANERDMRVGHSSHEAGESGDSSTGQEWHRLYVESVNRMRGPNEPRMTLEECMSNFPDPEKLQAIKREAYMQIYKAMGMTLEPADSGIAAAIELVQQLRESRLALMDYMHIARKRSPSQAMQNFYFEEQMQIMPPALPDLTQGMNLSQQQKNQIVEARRKFCDESALVRVHRQTILEKLRQSNMPQEATSASQVTMYRQMHSAQEAQDQLQKSLAEESVAMRNFAVAWTDAVTPWQEAWVVVEAYIKHSLLIDPWDIATVLETEATPGRNQHLQQESFMGLFPGSSQHFNGHQCQGM